MAPRVIQDSDDDLDSLSPAKPAPVAEPDQVAPGAGAATDADAPHAPALAPPSSQPEPTSPVALLGVDDPLGLLDRTADAALLVPTIAGAKRKPTTMELMASRKRAKGSVGDYAARDEGGRADRRRSASAGGMSYGAQTPASVEHAVPDAGAPPDAAPAQEAGSPAQIASQTATPVPARSHDASHPPPSSNASKPRATTRERSSTADFAAAHACSSQRGKSVSLVPDREGEPTLPELPAGASARSGSMAKPARRSRMEVPSSSDPGPDMPPPDTYRPRPSRSRAAGLADELFESIDFSKRPEKAGRGKRKGAKNAKEEKDAKGGTDAEAVKDTLDAQAGRHDSEHATAVKVEVANDLDDLKRRDEVPDLGETKVLDHDAAAPPDIALNGDATVEAPVRAATPPPPPDAEPKKKRGRPKKHERSSESEQSVAPEPKKRGRKARSAGDGLATVNEPVNPLSKVMVGDSDDEAGDELAAAPTAAQTAQKDRTPLSPSKSAANATAARKGKGKARTDAAAKGGDENAEPADGTTEVTKTEASAADPATPQKSTSALHDRSMVQTDAAKSKGPDKHSPLSGSKARYRVGLSRKARIEPLLRVVKK